MIIFVDFIFFILSSVYMYYSYKRIMFNKYSSVAFYVIIVIWFFCCLPILFNYIIGIPEYKELYWYRVFASPMNNSGVSVVYDIYILISIIVLFYYGKTESEKQKRICAEEKLSINQNNNNIFYIAIVFAPLIYVVVSGGFSKLFTYASLATRGIESQDRLNLNTLILLGVYSLCIYVFSANITKKKILFLIFSTIMLSWIQGKRFIVATMLLFYLFFLSKSSITLKTRKKLFKVIPFLAVLMIIFSGVYFVIIKPLSNMGNQTVYDMLRVDFGRDDVVKYVIHKEFFLNDHILDYPGQSFFSTLFIFIPKAIWPSKPHSHYQYLTSSILGLPISKLPAGTTPCWYEMCLCNFGYIGFLVGIVGLPLLCKIADKMKQVKSKSLVFMLILVLLTQNTDVYMVYIFLIFVYYFIEHIRLNNYIRNTKSQ